MEKYGTVPPKFTSEWWDYFWEYYKFHVLVACIVLFFAVTTLYQCATKINYDLNISFLGIEQIPEETKNKITETILPGVKEITGNEKKDVFYYQYYYNPSTSGQQKIMPQEDLALQQKYVIEMNAGECDVYIMPKAEFEALSAFSDLYTDVEEFYKKEYTDEQVIRDENGRAYAFSIAECEALSEYRDRDLYIGVRIMNSEREKKEKYVDVHAASLDVAGILSGSE